MASSKQTDELVKSGPPRSVAGRLAKAGAPTTSFRASSHPVREPGSAAVAFKWAARLLQQGADRAAPASSPTGNPCKMRQAMYSRGRAVRVISTPRRPWKNEA